MAVRHPGQFKARKNPNPRARVRDRNAQYTPGISLQDGSMHLAGPQEPFKSGDPVTEPATLKVQRPLGGALGECLVYNRTRSIQYFVPFDDAVKAMFRNAGFPPKMYVRAHLQPNTNEGAEPGTMTFRMIAPVEDQPW